MTAAEGSETSGQGRPSRNHLAGTEHSCQRQGAQRQGAQRSAGRRRAASGVTLAPAQAVPLDAEHERLALVYLAELLAPLFGSAGSA